MITEFSIFELWYFGVLAKLNNYKNMFKWWQVFRNSHPILLCYQEIIPLINRYIISFIFPSVLFDYDCFSLRNIMMSLDVH